MIPADETFHGTWPFAACFSDTAGFRQHYVDQGDGHSRCIHPTTQASRAAAREAWEPALDFSCNFVTVDPINPAPSPAGQLTRLVSRLADPVNLAVPLPNLESGKIPGLPIRVAHRTARRRTF